MVKLVEKFSGWSSYRWELQGSYWGWMVHSGDEDDEDDQPMEPYELSKLMHVLSAMEGRTQTNEVVFTIENANKFWNGVQSALKLDKLPTYGA